jgi:hypothetical protein
MMLFIFILIFIILAPAFLVPILSFKAFPPYTEAQDKADDGDTTKDTKC